MRWALRRVVPFATRFGPILRLGQWFRPICPASLRKRVPRRQRPLPIPDARHSRTMVALGGCVQKAATPNTNAASARVLDRLGVTLIEVPKAGCCGAVSYHLGAHEEGLDFARKNVDAWESVLEQGAEAIVVAASGCGSMIKEYGDLLSDDPAYAEKAKSVSSATKDLSEVVSEADLSRLAMAPPDGKIAVHTPCTLQHGQKLPDIVTNILDELGFELAATKEKHLCCGSAGAYSILQPTLSKRLLKHRLGALTAGGPTEIVTANVGCQLFLSTESSVPVRHWIEVVDEAIRRE